MTLNNLIAHSSQSRAMTGAEHLIFRNGLNGCFEAFLLVRKSDGLSRETLRDYRQKLGAFIHFLSRSGIVEINTITSIHIRLFLEELRLTCNTISVSDYFRVTRLFFNWLVGEEMLVKSPMMKMKQPKADRKVIRPFTREEIDKLLVLCNPNTFIGLRDRAIILTFLDTGLRLREMADVQLADIDMERELIKVMGKGARERYVRIGRETQKAITKYLIQRRDFYKCLWVSEERTPLTKWGITLIIRRLGQRAGLSGVRCSPHTFRHSFGTMALRNNADIREVQVLLGHSTLNMTMRYIDTIKSEDAIKGHRGDKDHPGFSPVDRLKLK